MYKAKLTAIVLGLLAPVLSFSIASGSGISALTTIGYSAQTFGIGTRITPYSPQVIDDKSNKNNKPDGTRS
jgi:hypothetical protein